MIRALDNGLSLIGNWNSSGIEVSIYTQQAQNPCKWLKLMHLPLDFNNVSTSKSTFQQRQATRF